MDHSPILEGRYVRTVPPRRSRPRRGLNRSHLRFMRTAFIADEDAKTSRSSRSEVSREKPVDYALMAQLMRSEKKTRAATLSGCSAGILTRVGRDTITWFRRENGYVAALLGGNAGWRARHRAGAHGDYTGIGHAGRPVPGGPCIPHAAINQSERRIHPRRRRSGRAHQRHYVRVRQKRCAVHPCRFDTR